MSRVLSPYVLLGLSFLAFSAPGFAMVGEKVNEPTLTVAHNQRGFDGLISDTVREIFKLLAMKDPQNAQEVSQRFNELATRLTQNISTFEPIGNSKLFQDFVKKLQNINVSDRQTALQLLDFLPNMDVKELNLYRLKLDDADMRILGPNLPSTLQELDLSANNIGDKGAIALVAKLPKSLQTLRLGGNNIRDAAALLLDLSKTALTELHIDLSPDDPKIPAFEKLRNIHWKRIMVNDL